MIPQTNWSRLPNIEIGFTQLGFGSAPLGNLYRAISNDEAQAILQAAWDSGVRYFDTAPLYGLGLSEQRIGQFLADKPRQDYVLSSKVGRLLRPCEATERTGIGKWFEVPQVREVFDYSYDGVLRSFEESQQRLGQDRIDILYGHDLCIFSHGSKAVSDRYIAEFLSGGYRALLELRDQGVIKAFGAGVNEWEVCQTLAEQGDFDLFLLAGRYTLLEQKALDSFLPLCTERGIGIVLGGPYNSGILASGPVAGAYYNYDEAPTDILERVAQIEAICKTHGVSLKAAALNFPLLHPAVVTVIPGGQSVAQATENRTLLSTTIPPALWTDLKAQGLLRQDAPTAS
jgi:D-threo-aldose 1-dehydrogenase